MPNITKILSPLEELLSRLPAGSKAAQEIIAAELAARKAAQEAAYAPHTLPTESGAAALEKSKKILGRAAGGLAEGGVPDKRDVSQLFPINPKFQSGPRTRAGTVPTEGDMISGAVKGLGETLLGAGRGAAATTLGGIQDLINMVDIPQIMTGESYQIPYGSEYFKENLPLKPTTQTGEVAQELGSFLPLDPTQVAKAGIKTAKTVGKALAPTAAEMALDIAERAGTPVRQFAVPPTEAKAGKIKAPANDLGFYSTVEKAALNLQRKSGTGDAFLADLLKNPGVSESRLDEMGLTALRGKKNVTADEVRALASENKVPLEESVQGSTVDPEETLRLQRNQSFLKYEIADTKTAIEAAKAVGNTSLAAEREQKLKYLTDSLNKGEQELKTMKPAKFGPETNPDLNIPGGENYREIRVKLPTKRLTENEARKVLGASPDAKLTEADITYASNKNKDQFFHQNHHGDEPDVLLHLRVADHVDAEGKKGLLIDELQSDWHQKARDLRKKEIERIANQKGIDEAAAAKLVPENFGYKTPSSEKARKEFTDYSNELANKYDLNPEQNLAMFATMKGIKPEEIAKYEQLQSAWVNTKGGVPDAPFKDNWYQLGLKRAIKEATDSGMDRIYLTTGKTQNERYDLSKQLSSVSYQDGVLRGYDNSGALVVNKSMTPDDLPNYVGKDLGKKMVESAKKDAEIRNKISVAKYEGAPESQIDSLRSQLNDVKTDYVGVDLKVGGEGMKQYYDKTYLNWLKKYAKEHNAEVGMTKLSGSDEPVYYLDLTPKLKETAKKGQSYADGGAVQMAEGGAVNSWQQLINSSYNTVPDMSDGGSFIQGPSFAEGGAVSNAWINLIEGAQNA